MDAKRTVGERIVALAERKQNGNLCVRILNKAAPLESPIFQ